MAVDTRRFDADPTTGLARFARGTQRDLDDAQSTILARLGALRFPRAVTTVSGLTGRYTGELVVNTTDNMIYRYDGSGWVGCVALGGSTAATRHEARYEQTTFQTISNNTDTKLQLNTAVTTCNDVVASGSGNQDFALNRDGVWALSAGLRYVFGSTGERDLFIATGTTVGTLANRVAGLGVPGSTFPITMSVSTELRVTSGTSVFAGTYQNNGGSLATEIGFGHTVHFAMTWLRP